MRFQLTPKQQRISIGQPLARALQQVIFHAGMGGRFEVVSSPDGEEMYRIKVFRLDPSGGSIYEGSERNEFEFFRVEICFPNRSTLTLFDDFGKQRGGSRFCKSQECLIREAKDVLENILCTYCLRSGQSCG
jgi:hypothetical protein